MDYNKNKVDFRKTYEALPHQAKQAIERDWLWRGENERLRGEGIGSHFVLLLWISEKYCIPMWDILSYSDLS